MLLLDIIMELRLFMERLDTIMILNVARIQNFIIIKYNISVNRKKSPKHGFYD